MDDRKQVLLYSVIGILILFVLILAATVFSISNQSDNLKAQVFNPFEPTPRITPANPFSPAPTHSPGDFNAPEIVPEQPFSTGPASPSPGFGDPTSPLGAIQPLVTGLITGILSELDSCMQEVDDWAYCYALYSQAVNDDIP